VRLRIIPDFGGILDIGNLKFQNDYSSEKNESCFTKSPFGGFGGF
jgi:hypothetical protein